MAAWKCWCSALISVELIVVDCIVLMMRVLFFTVLFSGNEGGNLFVIISFVLMWV